MLVDNDMRIDCFESSVKSIFRNCDLNELTHIKQISNKLCSDLIQYLSYHKQQLMNNTQNNDTNQFTINGLNNFIARARKNLDKKDLDPDRKFEIHEIINLNTLGRGKTYRILPDSFFYKNYKNNTLTLSFEAQTFADCQLIFKLFINVAESFEDSDGEDDNSTENAKKEVKRNEFGIKALKNLRKKAQTKLVPVYINKISNLFHRLMERDDLPTLVNYGSQISEDVSNPTNIGYDNFNPNKKKKSFFNDNIFLEAKKVDSEDISKSSKANNVLYKTSAKKTEFMSLFSKLSEDGSSSLKDANLLDSSLEICQSHSDSCSSKKDHKEKNDCKHFSCKDNKQITDTCQNLIKTFGKLLTNKDVAGRNSVISLDKRSLQQLQFLRKKTVGIPDTDEVAEKSIIDINKDLKINNGRTILAKKKLNTKNRRFTCYVAPQTTKEKYIKKHS